MVYGSVVPVLIVKAVLQKYGIIILPDLFCLLFIITLRVFNPKLSLYHDVNLYTVIPVRIFPNTDSIS